jgi:hypothetical protein
MAGLGRRDAGNLAVHFPVVLRFGATQAAAAAGANEAALSVSRAERFWFDGPPDRRSIR